MRAVDERAGQPAGRCGQPLTPQLLERGPLEERCPADEQPHCTIEIPLPQQRFSRFGMTAGG
jgi:hypothetical protein